MNKLILCIFTLTALNIHAAATTPERTPTPTQNVAVTPATRTSAAIFHVIPGSREMVVPAQASRLRRKTNAPPAIYSRGHTF